MWWWLACAFAKARACVLQKLFHSKKIYFHVNIEPNIEDQDNMLLAMVTRNYMRHNRIKCTTQNKNACTSNFISLSNCRRTNLFPFIANIKCKIKIFLSVKEASLYTNTCRLSDTS